MRNVLLVATGVGILVGAALALEAVQVPNGCDAEVKVTANGLLWRCPAQDCSVCTVAGYCGIEGPLPGEPGGPDLLRCLCSNAGGDATTDTCFVEIEKHGAVVTFSCVNNVNPCNCEPLFWMGQPTPKCDQLGPHQFWSTPCWCVGGHENADNPG